MKIELTPKQQESREAFRAFAELEIAPHADQYDESEQIPSGYLKDTGDPRSIIETSIAKYFASRMDGPPAGKQKNIKCVVWDLDVHNV